MISVGEGYNSEEAYKRVGELKKNGVTAIDGLKFRIKKVDDTHAPCFECQCKFFFSRKICQVCILLDYSNVKEKGERYLLEEVKDEL